MNINQKTRIAVDRRNKRKQAGYPFLLWTKRSSSSTLGITRTMTEMYADPFISGNSRPSSNFGEKAEVFSKYF